MSPERALEVLNEYVYGPRAFGKKPGDAALKAILAACAEERRAALTWAAEACRQEADGYVSENPGFLRAIKKCVWAIESERDAEGR